jgi:glycine dehydrogenase subunit 1
VSPPLSHPYMANSAPALRQELLDAIGVADVEELFEQLPADHRLTGGLDLPPALRSEAELERHLRRTLARNGDAERSLSFLGGGVWQHHVPAICDEIAGRTEFVTSEWGTPASDHGRNQAWFEFASQLGELVDLDFVGLPVYSWGCALGHAVRMAQRITGRREVLVPADLDPERRAVLETYCEPPGTRTAIGIVPVPVDPTTGGLDLDALRGLLSDRTAAVYLENPSSRGAIEARGAAISALAREHGAETIVGVDPLSLGLLAPPPSYGADIVIGSTQPLGIHMNCGGGTGGFIATRDDERYARQYPTLQVSIAPTSTPGEHGFAMALFEQSSYGRREEGNDWTGNSVYLWAVVNAVYMSLMGPEGFRELGELIVQRAHYAAARLAEIPGVSIAHPHFFKEFVVDLTDTGRTVADVNAALLERGIFGGARVAPGAGESDGRERALYCVTEVHAQEDLDRLASALREVLA